MPQNIILIVSPMCQDTPCKISDLSDHLCSCSTLIYAITSFRWMLFPKRFFFGPWGQTTPSWGWWLSTCDGPMYGITRNNSEKRVAKNILRGGRGSQHNGQIDKDINSICLKCLKKILHGFGSERTGEQSLSTNHHSASLWWTVT